MRQPDARKGATRYLVMGWLALVGCGREEVPADTASTRSSPAALESGVDLVVTELRGPASVRLGEEFTATVKVCNQGTVPSNGGPAVELFLSMDADVTMPGPDTPPDSTPADQVSIGYVYLDGPLYPAQCVTKSMYAYAWLPPAAQGEGAYYLAAAVDPSHTEQELREDNNVYVSGLMGVGHRADLVVSRVTAPANVRNGHGFTATVEVCNQGTASTLGGSSSPSYESPRVELFLSMDAELTLPDPSLPSPGMPADQQSLGYVELSQQLDPGQCVTKSMPVYASLPPAAQGDGVYYLVAAVDPTHAEEELREDNNVHVSGLIGVGYRSDLVVTQVSGPASLRPSQGFTAQVKVCNQGTAPTSDSGAPVDLFLLKDATLSMPAPGEPADPWPIESVNLDQPLSPGLCVTMSVRAAAHLPPDSQGEGAYYLAAAVDTRHVEQELREDNNIHVGGLVGVGHSADLVVTEVSAPASVRPGQDFMATVKVCNQGTYPSSYSNLELFLSMNPGLTLPDPSMPYPNPQPDQVSIGNENLHEFLQAGQCVSKKVRAYAYPPPAAQGYDGAYYLVAAVDTTHTEPELREDNNVHVHGLMGVGHSADLVVTEVSAPTSLRPGQDFMASVKVCNQGTYGNYGSPRLELFLAMNPGLTLPDPSTPYPAPQPDQLSIGSVELNQPLSPGQCVTTSVPAYAHPPSAAQGDGAYYLVAAVDTTHTEPELREDNNVHVHGLVGVGHRSDLVVTEVGAPASLRPGHGFTASVKVCNQGAAPTSNSSSTRLELFLAMNPELTLPDPSMPYPPMDQQPIGSVDLNQSLSPGQCVTTSVYASASLPPLAQGDGAYYLIAATDTNHAELELREDNNVHVHGLVGVGYRSDLVVTEVNAPASIEPDHDFTASVKVCNQGTAPTNVDPYYRPLVELFLSKNPGLKQPEPYMPYPPMDQQPIGSVDLDQSLSPGQCVMKSVYANASQQSLAQGDGAYYLIAAANMNQAELELREDNNVHVHGLVGVGYRSDLVVTEVNAPASIEPDHDFTASVKVCNQGTAPTSAGSFVDLYLSMDTELTLPEPSMPSPGPQPDQQFIGYVGLNQPLSPGQCVTESVPAYAHPPSAAQGDGAYYLVAAVDTTHTEPELREDNNVHVHGLVGVGYRSDLVVTQVSGPASLQSTQTSTATVKVCNQGTAPSLDTARLMVLLSMNAQLTMRTPTDLVMPTNQVDIGDSQVEPLPAGQCVTKNVSIFASHPPDAQGPGVFYLGAIIDTEHGVQELREDNNTRAESTIEIIP